MAPGIPALPGTLNIDGDYSQNADATLEIDLLSTTFFDKLAMTGSASLDGNLEVDVLPGFTPGRGR